LALWVDPDDSSTRRALHSYTDLHTGGHRYLCRHVNTSIMTAHELGVAY